MKNLNDLPEDLMLAKDAAAELGVSITTLYRRIRAGKIACWRLGSRYFVSKADLGSLFQKYVPRVLMPTDAEWARRHAESNRILREVGAI